MIDLFRDSKPRWIAIVLRSLPILIGNCIAAILFATNGVSTASALGLILFIFLYILFWFIFDIFVHAEVNRIINLQPTLTILKPTEGPRKVIESEQISEKKTGPFIQREYVVYDVDPDDLIDKRYVVNANPTNYTILLTEMTDVSDMIDNVKFLTGSLVKNKLKKQYTVDVDHTSLPDNAFIYALDSKLKDTKIQGLLKTVKGLSENETNLIDEFQERIYEVSTLAAKVLEGTNDVSGGGSGISKELKEKQITTKSGIVDSRLRNDLSSEIKKLEEEMDQKYSRKLKEITDRGS